MTLIFGILITLIILLIVVLIHEFGHFFAARMTGMKVEEFGFGIPPRVATLFRDKKWTEYTFNLLPIGGFVRIFWEDPNTSDATKKWAFMTKRWYARAIVLVAWVTMNFFLAYVLFFGMLVSWVKPLSINPLSELPTYSYFLPSFDEAVDRKIISHSGIILEPLTGSIAEQSWIKTGDRIISVNGKTIKSPKNIITEIQSSPVLDMTLEDTSGNLKNIKITPQNKKIGTAIRYKNLEYTPSNMRDVSALESFSLALHETVALSRLTFTLMWDMASGLFAPANEKEFEDAKNMLSWPIGMGAWVVDLVKNNVPISILVFMTALLSINLWIFNLLPFPALDGGRLLTTTLYSILVRGFHRSAQYFIVFERYFHATGFVLLLVLMLYVAGLDVGRLFS